MANSQLNKFASPDELTRDYQPNVEDPYLRIFRLFPWQPCDVDEEIAKHLKEMEQDDKEDKKEVIRFRDRHTCHLIDK